MVRCSPFRSAFTLLLCHSDSQTGITKSGISYSEDNFIGPGCLSSGRQAEIFGIARTQPASQQSHCRRGRSLAFDAAASNRALRKDKSLQLLETLPEFV
jgi:hypothetical protein